MVMGSSFLLFSLKLIVLELPSFSLDYQLLKRIPAISFSTSSDKFQVKLIIVDYSWEVA
jgi:hypothetical protein